MADSKLTALPVQTAATTDDILYVVNDPNGSPVSRKITFDNFQKSITDVASVNSAGDVKTPVTNYYYLGSESVDGSWRFAVIAGSLSFQKRESGSWVEKGSVTP